MDFEFNQSSTNSANGVTKVRTEGDMLVTFDFGGSGVPVLSLSRWLAAGNGHTSSDCEVPSDGIPCWSALENLTTASEADGSVNNANVIDNNPPNNPRTLAGSVSSNGSVSSTFGEAGINLTEAGVFNPGICQHFGAASLKSRSSGQSFTSTLKDFIAPIPVNISNCGTIKIIKHTDPRGINKAFTFNAPTISGATYSHTLDASNNFTLNDSGNTNSDNAANTQEITNVPGGGPYVFTEALPNAGFALTDITCVSASGDSTFTTDKATGNATVTNLVADDTVTCTYTNQQQLGAIKVTKASIKGNTALAGAKFSITGPNSFSTTLTTGADGSACVENLPFGTYSVTETQAPSGFVIDNPNAVSAVVNANSTCASGPVVKDFTDTPLTDLLVKATSQASTGGTQSSIKCVDASNADIGNSPVALSNPAQMDATGLNPGTYTCTIVIDP
jgi:hypothetical protein